MHGRAVGMEGKTMINSVFKGEIMRLRFAFSGAILLAATLSSSIPAPAQTPPPPPTPPCGPNVEIKNVAHDSRCFELRTYTVREGSSIDLLHSRFREHTTALFKKHGMTIIGYWHPVAQPNTLIY